LLENTLALVGFFSELSYESLKANLEEQRIFK